MHRKLCEKVARYTQIWHRCESEFETLGGLLKHQRRMSGPSLPYKPLELVMRSLGLSILNRMSIVLLADFSPVVRLADFSPVVKLADILVQRCV